MQLIIIIGILSSLLPINQALSGADSAKQSSAPSQFDGQRPFKMTIDFDYHDRYPNTPCNDTICAALNPTEVSLHALYDFDNLTYPIQIHRVPDQPVLYDLDCDGDGTFEWTNLTDDHICRYNSGGPHQIAIRGNIPGLFLGHKSTLATDACNKNINSPLCPDPKLAQTPDQRTEFNTGFPVISIDQWGGIPWKTMAGMAKGCINMHLSAKDAPNLKDVTDISEMFTYAYSFNEPVEHWDVSNVKYMNDVFHEAFPFNQPLGKWNVSNVSSMHGMFQNTNKFNQPLNLWNVSNVTDTSYMFHKAMRFNQPLNLWNVSNVTTMQGMFSYAQRFNSNLLGWNTSRVTDMSLMFERALHFDQNINSWDTSNVTDMHAMFKRAERFDKPLDKWNVSNVKRMDDMFAEAYAFNQPINNWNTSNVVSMKKMFWFAQKFNKPLGKWNTSNVEYMESMFKNALNFVQNLDSWDLSNVKDDKKTIYPHDPFHKK